CSCFAAGLRVFDIHEPSAPREVAYFKPPAQGTRALHASQYASLAPTSFSREFDWTTAKVSWPRDRGSTSGDIWLTSHDNGFLVVRLDPSVLPDITPPVISATTSPAANGHGWNNTDVAAADAMSGVDASSFRLDVTSSEPAAGDILVSGGAVSLRAERSGGGTGRDYDFMASVSDLAGNVATALATCSVPHDRGR